MMRTTVAGLQMVVVRGQGLTVLSYIFCALRMDKAIDTGMGWTVEAERLCVKVRIL